VYRKKETSPAFAVARFCHASMAILAIFDAKLCIPQWGIKRSPASNVVIMAIRT
jgi:hypothetical protein